MILARLEDADRVYCLNDKFKQAFEFLRTTDLSSLQPGRHEVLGKSIYAIAARDNGRPRSEGILETHRSYIDIQYVIDGEEEMGWLPRSLCRTVRTPYDPEKDFELYEDRPVSWCTVLPGSFAIFFPEDAHAPLIGSSIIRKVVMKVAVNAE